MEKMYKFTKSILILLVVQFVLGMIINLWGVLPDEETATHKAPIFAQMAFAAHGIIGLMILISSTTILIMGLKSKDNIKKFSIYGFVSVLIAFIGGIGVVTLKENSSEIASFVMSIGFLLSLVSYGKLFSFVKK